MKELLIDVCIFTAVLAYCLFIYWACGGEFERGCGLGFTVIVATICGVGLLCNAGKEAKCSLNNCAEKK